MGKKGIPDLGPLFGSWMLTNLWIRYTSSSILLPSHPSGMARPDEEYDYKLASPSHIQTAACQFTHMVIFRGYVSVRVGIST